MRLISHLSIHLLAAAEAAVGAALQPRFTAGQTVSTNNGPIQGHAASVATQVSEYLGIPFAKPPVNQLRFAPPVNYTGDGKTFVASSISPSCPALGGQDVSTDAHADTVKFGPNGVAILNEIVAANTPYSENCLKLNIWTKPQTGAAKKAVLLWIYGGGFIQGATNNTIYNGQFLADRQDVVVVNFNYRTNIFGFPGAPNLVQNVGLLDQRLAVQWVRDNIAAFGGDPSKITLFGQSAGGASLDYYSLAYYNNDPIVNGFIQESGNTIQIGPSTPQSGQYNWWQVTSQLGCGDSGTADQNAVVSCMRNQTVANILQAAANKSASFVPVADNKTAFSDSTSRFSKGAFIQKPILIGSNNGEANYVSTISQAQTGIPVAQALLDYFTLTLFTCPARTAASLRIQNNVPTWRYRFYGLFDKTVVSYQPYSGVYHAAEIPYVFGTANLLGAGPDTAAQANFTSYVQGAWASFAKDPVNGLTSYGWPSYDPNAATMVQLGLNNTIGPNPINPSQSSDVLCAVGDTTLDLYVAASTALGQLTAGAAYALGTLF